MAYEQFAGFDPAAAEATAAGLPRVADTLPRTVVALKHALRIGETQKAQILVSEASLGVVVDIDAGALETGLDIVLRLTGESETVVRALHWRDAQKVMAACRAALPPRLRERL